MPAYNAEKYIGEAIESILGQSYSDFELIIANDCSTDATLRIIEDYAKKDGRIIPINNEKNLNIALNRSLLISLAKGKYIAWQDADDISLLHRLERQYNLMEENGEVGICGGWLHFFDDKGKINSIRRYKATDAEVRSTIFRYSPVAQPCAMIRRSILEEIGFYDLHYPPAEDLDMSFRIGKKHKFANLQEVLVKYRENPSGATFTRLSTMEYCTFSIRLRYSDGVHYKMSLFDHIYNITQYISTLVIPPKLKIFLFNFVRNSKK